MTFDIVTIFPHIFDSYFSESIIKRAQKKKKIKIKIHDLRKFTTDKHKTVDDKPYGGGVGMVMKVEPVYRALRAIKKIPLRGITRRATRKSPYGGSPAGRQENPPTGDHPQGDKKTKMVLFTPAGKKFNQEMARRLAMYDRLIMICPRYEGHDARIEKMVDEKISIGDYILTGGEIPAMIVVDAVTRLLPGVLGKDESNKDESFSREGYLEYPHYTRPETFCPGNTKVCSPNSRKARYWRVPKVLLSGNHEKISNWRQKHSKCH